MVHETDRAYADASTTDRMPVTLKAGRNTILCKIGQKKGANFLCLRIADNLFDRAFVQAELGLWKDSAALFARAIDRNPAADFSLYARCIHAHLVLGDTAGARRYLDRQFERYDRDDPGASARANSARAGWLAYGGVLVDGAIKPAHLVELAERALETEKYPWNYFVAGVAHYRAGQFDKAIGRYTEALNDPRWRGNAGQGHLADLGLALAHHGLGHAKEARELLDKAEERYQKVINDALAAPPAVASLIPWTEWPGFMVLRREAHQRILGSDVKDDPRIRTLADRMRAWLDQRDKATLDYDVAILRSPAEPRFYLARGRRLAELTRFADAEADFAKAVALRPDDPRLLRERGRMYTELGQPDKAAADFAEAQAYVPTKDSKAIPPEEAAQKIGERCVVEMVVQSAGKSKGAFFLNSSKDYKDAGNFVVFIGAGTSIAFKYAKIDDPASYYEGKTIRVAGRVTLYQERPEIAIASPEQIQIVEKKAPAREISSK